MKDSEFIELLNLYLDHEISAEDAARLEGEVQSNPARRQVYRQYCQMQKACKMLTHDFQTEPAAAEKVVPFQPAAASRRAGQGGGFYTIGALVAAAACVAIILVGRSRPQPSDNPAPTFAEAKVTPVKIDTPAAQARATNPIRRNTDATFVAGNTLLLSSNHSANLATANASQPPADQFDWLRADVKLVSADQQLAADQLRFQAAPTTLRPEGGQQLGKRGALKQQEPAKEMVIFQFQR